MDGKILRDAFYRYLTNFLGKDEATSTAHDRYMALAYAVRSEFMKNWIATQKRYHEKNLRRVYYLSTEYILGKSLFQNIMNHGIEQEMAHVVKSLGFSIDTIYEQEDDFMLGNGSEARLAACLLEAMASHGYPAMAYGLRYEYGLFRQEIKKGVQVELPNDWLRRGNPWEIERPEYAHIVQFGGECRSRADNIFGAYEWRNTESVLAIPYDIPIVGFRNGTVNTLRLWSARATEEFLPDYLNHRDYERAYADKSKFSDITKMLFPDEDVRRATDLRMRQQFFFISASLQDIVRRFKRDNNSILDLDKKVVIHLGGSRCALAIPELMRLLVDHEGVPWEKAWEITKKVFSYTSHAVFREDSEVWPVYKVGQLLPRHLQVMFDINQIHLDEVRKKNGNDSSFVRDLSLVEEGEVKRIRFADMAVLGSFSVNGVSREQTAILRAKVFPHFARYFTDRFSCTVNGISLRRWLLNANRPLGLHITKHIGDRWIRHPEQLIQLEKVAGDEKFLRGLDDIKTAAKSRLASHLRSSLGVPVDPAMVFDVQLAKMHGSKRQMLHLLHIIYRYLCVKRGQKVPGGGTRRLHLFSGKASPSDFLAKQIMHCITMVANRVNNDPQANTLMQVVLIPDFSLSWAEIIPAAADLSEQLTTAGFEPSGTFAMKLAANGAVTVCSRSGAAIELAEAIGSEYILTFGKTGEELLAQNGYRPSDCIAKDERLKDIFSFLENDLIPSTEEGHAMYPLLSTLRDSDRQFVLLDFADYVAKQEIVDAWYNDPSIWQKARLMNIARSGWFSIDRAVREYAEGIWKIASI